MIRKNILFKSILCVLLLVGLLGLNDKLPLPLNCKKEIEVQKNETALVKENQKQDLEITGELVSEMERLRMIWQMSLQKKLCILWKKRKRKLQSI